MSASALECKLQQIAFHLHLNIFTSDTMTCCLLSVDQCKYLITGGLIVNAMREENTREVDEYLNIHEVFASWTKKGLWKCLEHANPPVKFYAEYHPLVHVYEVTK